MLPSIGSMRPLLQMKALIKEGSVEIPLKLHEHIRLLSTCPPYIPIRTCEEADPVHHDRKRSEAHLLHHGDDPVTLSGRAFPEELKREMEILPRDEAPLT